jgi:hypothetical protein
MKNQKFKLAELRVQSFVTSLETDHDGTLKGGYIPASWIDGCQSGKLDCTPGGTRGICAIITANCGSLVDACPSALGCPVDQTILETSIRFPVRRF